ncbi:MAG: tRNA pseudouridine(38-40) synthase TruA [Gammaproteobacteria bacterium]|nr:MAG: tRNA pseudouridine(38-40) synthase TruA [Gammaproteobacteria bacterium]PIE36709.1 MAG: tRNA pseudouridine(38-40) synthase TruA [Gammaproteobacteria bacterium]
MRRYALAVEYHGGGFCGWQRQPHCHSVQAELEQALATVADEPIVVHCAGRTDTGVHAQAQVVHFDTTSERPLTAWTFGVNSNLDKRVAVHWASAVSDDFDARHSATARSYRYTLLNRATRPGREHSLLAWERHPLDVAAMHTAAQQLLGEHDFSSFRSAECQAHHARRAIMAIAVRRDLDRVMLEVTANGFLHNMVRIIVGSLLKVGRGEQPIGWIGDILTARDRRLAGATAAPDGLCFLQPTYPECFGVPDFEALRTSHWRP